MSSSSAALPLGRLSASARLVVASAAVLVLELSAFRYASHIATGTGNGAIVLALLVMGAAWAGDRRELRSDLWVWRLMPIVLLAFAAFPFLTPPPRLPGLDNLWLHTLVPVIAYAAPIYGLTRLMARCYHAAPSPTRAFVAVSVGGGLGGLLWLGLGFVVADWGVAAICGALWIPVVMGDSMRVLTATGLLLLLGVVMGRVTPAVHPYKVAKSHGGTLGYLEFAKAAEQSELGPLTSSPSSYAHAMFTDDVAKISLGMGRFISHTLTPAARLHGNLSGTWPIAFVEERPQRVFSVGCAAGRDVQLAQLLGAREIHCAEVDPAVYLVSKQISDWRLGSFLDQPGVLHTLGEGRATLSQTEGRFDLIMLLQNNSAFSAARYLLSLSESVLFTREAFALYLSKVNEDGVVHIVKPRLVLYLPALAAAIDGFEDKVLFGTDPKTQGIMEAVIRPRPWTADEIAAYRARYEAEGATIQAPGAYEPQFRELFDGPVITDDWPVAGYLLTRRLLDPEAFASRQPALTRYGGPGVVSKLSGSSKKTGRRRLKLLLTLGGLLAFAALAVPRVLRGSRGLSPRLWFAGALCGVAFVQVELVLIERVVVRMATVWLAVPLFLSTFIAMLGAGALLAERRPRTMAWLPAVGAAVLALFGGPLASALGAPGWDWLACVVMSAGAGVCFGGLFPQVLRQDPRPERIWAANALGSILGYAAYYIAVHAEGMQVASASAVVFYGLAAVLLSRRRASSPA